MKFNFKSRILFLFVLSMAAPLAVFNSWAAGQSASAGNPGEPAPAFSVRNQDGQLVTLAQNKGKPVLLYFYPKDDTPGCTKQACMLRDTYQQFQKEGAVIYGVSRQDAKSHQEFKKKHRLPFDLLIDEDGSLAKSFGVGLYPVVGFHKRESILIDGTGTIIKHYKDVDPQAHAAEVLNDLQKLKLKK